MNGARYAYLKQICELIKQGEDIVLVTADYAAPTLDDFRIQFPERYVSVGIAEQNLIQVACGLALAGKRVVAYAMAPFPCTRAFDQIRNAACMMHLPISIVSAGIGFAIPEFGATHYNAEDMSIIRTLPNCDIINVTDNVMAENVANLSLTNSNPLYIRFDKYSEGIYYQKEEIDMERGYSVTGEGNDAVIISYGYHFTQLAKMTETFEKKNIHVKIVDLFKIPFNEKELLAEINDAGCIITVEEHVLNGGLGSVILEMLSDHMVYKPVKRIGIDFNSRYPETFGNREYYNKEYGLEENDVIEKVESFIKLNKEAKSDL